MAAIVPIPSASQESEEDWCKLRLCSRALHGADVEMPGAELCPVVLALDLSGINPLLSAPSITRVP